MKWIEISVIYKPQESVLVEELISEVFEEAETGGVSVERPDIEPVEGWDPGPVYIPDKFRVKGYIPADKEAELKCNIIESGINNLIKNGIYCEIEYSTINDEDWAEKWKEYFRPEKIGKKIVVKPTWRDYDSSNEEIVIEVDPGMAFGTGSHPTTAMCIRLMETWLKPENTFLDIGTGSGLLMIAAEKLGAINITGTDIDRVAIETAEKNILLNGIDPDSVTLITGNLSDKIDSEYDVITANILADVIVELLDKIHEVIRTGGLFICSGILEEQVSDIVIKMESCGFTIVEIMHQDAWAAVCGRKDL